MSYLSKTHKTFRGSLLHMFYAATSSKLKSVPCCVTACVFRVMKADFHSVHELICA